MSKNLAKIVASAVLAILVPAAAANAGQTLYVDDSSGNLGKVDTATGAVTMIGSMGTVMTDIAFDPSGNLWGVTFTDLYKINASTAAVTYVGPLGGSAFVNALAFKADGTLYGAMSDLYTINTATGAATSVGSMGVTSSGDLAFHSGLLYMSASGGDTLVTLNTGTGAATAVGPIGYPVVYGLANGADNILYGVAGTDVFPINAGTGAGGALVSYAAQGLGSANGTAFRTEAGATGVPTPAAFASGAALLAGLGFARFFRRSK